MKTLNVTISDNDYKMYGIKNDQLSFADMVKIVTRVLTKQRLDKSIELAKQYGLSEMTMDEITEEVKAVRNAKAGH